MNDKNSLFSNDAEQHVDHLLATLGEQGMLDDVLNEADIDHLLATMPLTQLSENFSDQALLAMARAQEEREHHNPAIALGVTLARARQRTGLDLQQLGHQVGASQVLLGELETGQLPLRRLLYVLPATVVAQLLRILHLPVHEFTTQLIELASMGNKPHGMFTAVAHRAQHTDTATLVTDVAEYVATLEHLSQTT